MVMGKGPKNKRKTQNDVTRKASRSQTQHAANAIQQECQMLQV